MAEEELIYRGGMLCPAKQLETRASPGQNKTALPNALVMEFCISLIKEVHSPDLLWLSADVARHRSGATKEQRDILLAYIHQMKRGDRDA